MADVFLPRGRVEKKINPFLPPKETDEIKRIYSEAEERAYLALMNQGKGKAEILAKLREVGFHGVSPCSMPQKSWLTKLLGL